MLIILLGLVVTFVYLILIIWYTLVLDNYRNYQLYAPANWEQPISRLRRTYFVDQIKELR
jgi:hypothetical protein